MEKSFLPTNELPNLHLCEKALLDDEWDEDSWRIVIDEVEQHEMQLVEPIYKKVIEQYPTNAQIYISLIKHYVKEGNREKGEELFKTILYTYPNTQLWEYYLQFKREVLIPKDFPKLLLDDQRNNVKELTNCFTQAKDRIGFCVNSYPVWKAYIDFLDDLLKMHFYKEVDGVNLLREVYQEAIKNPINDVDTLWKDYGQFEKRYPSAMSDKKIQEQLPYYKKALAIYQSKRDIWNSIILGNVLACPPKGTKNEREQLTLWRKAIQFEITNPQQLAPDIHVFRIRTLYLQCLCVLRYHIDIWYDFAEFEMNNNNPKEAELIFRNACGVLKDSLIIQFLLSEFLENQNKIAEAKSIFDSLIEKYKAINDDKQQARLTTIFVEYQRFLLRNEGLETARAFFRSSIKTYKCGPQLYISTAQMELENTSNIEIARRIYQLGYTQFPDEPTYLLSFIEFLEHLGDGDNIKSIFESALSTLPEDRAKDIWPKYLEFLYWKNAEGMNLLTLSQVEERRAKALSHLGNLHGLLNHLHRYKFPGISSLTTLDVSLQERYDSITGIPLTGHTLEESTLELQSQKIGFKDTTRRTDTTQHMPEFLLEWINKLPPIDTKLSSEEIDEVFAYLREPLPEYPLS